MGEWIHALRGLSGNPLWRHLARPPRRGWQRWGNIALAVLLGGGFPAIFILSLLRDSPELMSHGRLFYSTSRDEVLAATCGFLLLFAVVALAVSLLLVTGDALSVLAAPGRRLSRQQLDEAVLLTRLRPCEIVVAVVAANLGRLFWPIVALASFVGVHSTISGAMLGATRALPSAFGRTFVPGRLSLTPLTALGMLIPGMLAGVLLILVMLALGRGLRSGIVLTAAGVGQVVALLLYFWFSPGMMLVSYTQLSQLPTSPLIPPSGGFAPALATMLLIAVPLCVLLGLARWSGALRTIVAPCWQLLAGVPFLVLAFRAWPLSPSSWLIIESLVHPLTPAFLNTAQAWGLTLPLNFFAVPHGGALGLATTDPLHIPYFEWWRWPLVVAVQLALIAFAATQARLAVVLRFRGQ